MTLCKTGARGPHRIYLGLLSHTPALGNATHSLLSTDQPMAWAAEWCNFTMLHGPTPLIPTILRHGLALGRSYRPIPRCNWAAADRCHVPPPGPLPSPQPLSGAALPLHLCLVGFLLVVRLNHGCNSCSVLFLQWLMSRWNTYPKSCRMHSSLVIGCSTRASVDILLPLG